MSIQGQEPPYRLEPMATFHFPEMDPDGHGGKGTTGSAGLLRAAQFSTTEGQLAELDPLYLFIFWVHVILKIF